MNLRRNFFLGGTVNQINVTLFTFLSLTSTYFVLSLFLSFWINLNQVVSSWGNDISMLVFLRPEVTESEITSLKEYFRGNKQIKEFHFISKDQAANSMRDQMKELAPDLLSDPNLKDALPASFNLEMSWANTIPILQLLPTIANEISQLSGVEEVSYGKDWVSNYKIFKNVVFSVGSFLGLVLILTSVLSIGNVIRGSVFSRKEEIEILELVGATRFQIRWPFIIHGSVLSGLAALLALVLARAIVVVLDPLSIKEVTLWGLSDLFNHLPLGVSLIFILCCTVLGALAASLSVQRINSGWAAAQARHS